MILLSDFVVWTDAGIKKTVRGTAIDDVLPVGQAEIDSSNKT